MPRLLLCKNKDCQTLEELPIWTGPKEKEADDPLLNELVKRHLQRHGDTSDAVLMTVEDSIWVDPAKRDGILKELSARNTGFSPEVYSIKNTFQEDALRCYSQHGRPKEGCIDYCNSNKLLTSDAWVSEEEKQLDKSDLMIVKGHKKELEAQNPVYLCNYCPVQSWVTTKIRLEAGVYK
jgi:hypothetical protein